MSQIHDRAKQNWLVPTTFGVILLVYLGVFLFISNSKLNGDEKRYALQATNLTQGFFIQADRLQIDNGPGYPLMLTPFAELELNWRWAKLLNPFLMVGAFWILYLTTRQYVEWSAALWGVVLTSCYYPFMRDFGRLITEPLTCLLVSAWAYLVCALWRHEGVTRTVLTGAVFGYLCLTKVIFGYLLVVALFCFGVWALVGRDRRVMRLLASLVLAAFVCIPYLSYTQSLTGKSFFWADAGAYNLYWMSSPHSSDTGSWHKRTDVFSQEELAPHREFFAELSQMPYEERSTALMRKAKENIKNHPGKYVRNWFANVGRLIFNYPIDYAPQTINTYFYFVANSIVIYLVISSLWSIWKLPIKLPPEHLVLTAAALIVLGGTSLAYANVRMARPLLLLLSIPMIVVFTQRIQLRAREQRI